MQQGSGMRPDLVDIDEIYLEGIGYHRKEAVYDYLIIHPGSIRVGIEPYPAVLPATSQVCEKYVRSGLSSQDRLLDLPIETVSTESVQEKKQHAVKA